MNIHLHTQGFELTTAIQTHVNRQIDFNLSNFATHIQAVDVYLKDINGPKGGCDMKAIVCVSLMSRQVVKVECTRDDLYVAVSMAARQAKRSVKRGLSRNRHMSKLAARELRQFPQF